MIHTKEEGKVLLRWVQVRSAIDVKYFPSKDGKWRTDVDRKASDN